MLAQPSELRELVCTLILEAREAMAGGGVLAVTTRQERGGAALVMTHPVAAPTAAAIRSRGASERGVTLAAARDRARRWGGDLVVEARGGRLTLRLSLPAAPAAARRRRRARRGVPAPARRILVVDDDAGNRETLTELLGLSGHDVVAAESGKDALAVHERAERGRSTWRSSTWRCPTWTAWRWRELLRARDPALRIALVTGWEPGAVDGNAEPGLIEAIFRKPIDLPAINRFLDGAQPSAVSHQPSATE